MNGAGQNQDQSENETLSEDAPTFDMYRLFSRWDFILLVLFVLATLVLTILIVLSGPPVA
jgi:hypothetical protein